MAATLAKNSAGLRRALRRSAAVVLAMLGITLLARTDATNETSVIRAQPAEEETADEPQQDRSGYLIQVPLPVTADVDQKIRRMVDRLLSRLPDAADPRPILVLEFVAKEGQAGETSEFERCLSLARYLTSEDVSPLRTVAYLPQTVKGHAALVALACEEIVMHNDAALGEAGINEDRIDDTIRFCYRNIVERRRGANDTPFVLGMLDRDLEVLKVKTPDGVRYVLPEELRQLEEQGKAADVTTVTRAGELPSFSGAELRDTYQFVSYLASDRKELASVLGLPQGSLEGDPSLGDSWHAVRFDLRGPVEDKVVAWMVQALTHRLRNEETNLIVVWLDSDRGSLSQCLVLAHFLAELESSEVRTVAYIPYKARGGAALIAMACDHIVMGQPAVLGGPAAESAETANDVLESIQALAAAKRRDWSLFAALVDSQRIVHRYVREGSGEVRYLCADEHAELEDPDVWLRGREIDTAQGFTGSRAEEIRLARYLADDYEQFKQLYHLQEEPELLEPSWAQKWTERLADQLSRPMIAGWLIFAAMFFLSVEFSHPGLSAPGFISAVCFLLFFWSQFLHGTAEWLEILLFVVGVVFLALELFVIPGWGIFGVGGALMVIVSIVLASQTFIVPRTTADWNALPGSLSSILFSGGGIVAAVFVIRRFLPHTPYFRKMMLNPPSTDDNLPERESIVHWQHLSGKQGVTTTQLTPSGKARFGDEVVDVISDGELIPRGANVYVADVHGNHVLVKLVDGEPGA